MKSLVAGMTFAIALLTIGNANAAPLALSPMATNTEVVMVAQGCGVGFRRGPNDSCRPQAKGPAIMRLFARKCPLGYSRNLIGKCRKS